MHLSGFLWELLEVCALMMRITVSCQATEEICSCLWVKTQRRKVYRLFSHFAQSLKWSCLYWDVATQTCIENSLCNTIQPIQVGKECIGWVRAACDPFEMYWYTAHVSTYTKIIIIHYDTFRIKITVQNHDLDGYQSGVYIYPLDNSHMWQCHSHAYEGLIWTRLIWFSGMH